MAEFKFVVVVPAFNEESSISNVIRLSKQHAEVVVLNDCSSDKTVELANAAGANVFSNKSNLGYEESVNLGVSIAFTTFNADAVVVIDADGEHDPSTLRDFKSHFLMNDADLVIGKRSGSKRLAEKVIGFLIKKKYGISDIFCGMKGYSKALWNNRQGTTPGGLIGTDLCLAAARSNIKFFEVVVTGKPREDKPRFGPLFGASFKLVKVGIKQMLSKPDSTLSFASEGQSCEYRD